MPRPFPFPLHLGTDICSLTRIAAVTRRHPDRFIARVLTAPEREVYASILKLNEEEKHVPADLPDSRSRLVQFLAGRWAAKEAIIKACYMAGRRGVRWNDIVILPRGVGPTRNDRRTREAHSTIPQATVLARVEVLEEAETVEWHERWRCGQEVRLSISHDGDFATAVAMYAEEEEDRGGRGNVGEKVKTDGDEARQVLHGWSEKKIEKASIDTLKVRSVRQETRSSDEEEARHNQERLKDILAMVTEKSTREDSAADANFEAEHNSDAHYGFGTSSNRATEMESSFEDRDIDEDHSAERQDLNQEWNDETRWKDEHNGKHDIDDADLTEEIQQKSSKASGRGGLEPTEREDFQRPDLERARGKKPLERDISDAMRELQGLVKEKKRGRRARDEGRGWRGKGGKGDGSDDT